MRWSLLVSVHRHLFRQRTFRRSDRQLRRRGVRFLSPRATLCAHSLCACGLTEWLDQRQSRPFFHGQLRLLTGSRTRRCLPEPSSSMRSSPRFPGTELSTACWRPFPFDPVLEPGAKSGTRTVAASGSFHVVMMQGTEDHWDKPSVQEGFHVYHWKGMVMMFNMCTFDGGASLQMLEDHM